MRLLEKAKKIYQKIYRKYKKTKLYACRKRRKDEKKAFRFAKAYLKKGWYYFPKSARALKKLDLKAFLIPNIFHIHICFSQKGTCTFMEYGVGANKVVLLKEQEAIGFFLQKKDYALAKNNYLNCYKLFNYPCAPILAFHDESQSVVTERVYGTTYADKEHDRIVVESLLECTLSADVIPTAENGAVFLQHGDAKWRNVIWKSETDFRLIDLDNIGYYPPLLDVLHYLNSSKRNLEEIVAILLQKIDVVKQICKRAGMDTSDSMLDELFYRYISYYNALISRESDFRFLTVENTVDYPKTNKLLQSIKQKA